jgi:hypothetical protein
MALTDFQRTVCRLLADHRISSGESYVAGATALNELIGAPRISRDIDLFHDTDEALEASWESDQRLLRRHDFEVRVVRQRPAFVEAEVSRRRETVIMEWARDSAYRFFPLLRHPDLGLTLHPFDLATNKVLALVGRLEVRDWIDVIHASERIQTLGYLAWAACGKDPGFSPAGILEHAARSTHYAAPEILALSFQGEPPDPAALARRWHTLMADARAVVAILPAAHAGTCVLGADGTLFARPFAELQTAVERGILVFHHGRIRGALPRLQSPDRDP